MKRIMLLTILILFAGVLSGQTFKKGNLVGFHIGTVNLSPGVTYEQWETFLKDKVFEAYNKEFKGEIMVYLADGERGKYGKYIGRIMVIKSVKVRNKYFPEPGKGSELFRSKMEKVQPLVNELEKLGTYVEDHYTDWIIR